MTTPITASYGTITLKAIGNLPARLLGGAGIDITPTGGFAYRVDMDIAELPVSPIGAAAGKFTAVWDSVSNTLMRIEFTQLPAPIVDWSLITGKPSTFPPTLPIAESGVTNLVADLAARPTEAPVDGHTYGRKNGTWQDVAAGVSVTVNWTDIVGKPATFPPSAHTHPESDVINLVTDLAARELIANKGAVNGYAPLDATSKVPVANLPAFPAEAPNDGKVYGRGSLTWQNVTDTFTAKTGATGASNIPSGNTAQRPANSVGLLRWNTDITAFEYNNGAGWATFGGVAKTGDTMSGALQVRAVLATTPYPATVATTVLSTLNEGYNAYYNQAGTGWLRDAANYAAVLTYSTATGTLAWNTGGTGAAGGALTLTQTLSLDTTGNLVAAGNVTGVNLNLTTGGVINTNSGVNLGLSTGGANRVTVNASNGGVNIAPAAGTNAGLFVGIPAGTGAGVIATGPAAAGYGVLGYCTGQTIFGSLGAQVSAQNWSIYGSASAFLGSGTWQSSDARLKDIIVGKAAFDRPAVDIIAAVPIRAFRFKGPLRDAPNGDRDQFGWIAQELEAVLPLAVCDVGVAPADMVMRAFLTGASEAPMAESDEGKALGEVDVPMLKAVNHQYLIATLWQAVQELSARVKALEG